MTQTGRGTTLVVAARSARLLAQAAARAGWRVVALDVFGDADTRRAAADWQAVGVEGSGGVPRIDAAKLLAALERPRDAIGWIAGSDLDGESELLEAGAQRLPLLGTAPADVRRVRDPRRFFDALDALGLAHPATAFEPPADGAGWLRKLPRGCGGWHIRRVETARQHAAEPSAYFQREAPGTPMSALFVAGLGGDGTRNHRLVGFNELVVRPFGAHPYVYRGAIGPVDLPAAPARALGAAIDALVEAFALRGLASLDFLWHDGTFALLEINPRPSASMALYADQPLIAWHLQACGAVPRASTAPQHRSALRGIETVFAREAFTLGVGTAAALAGCGDCHDLPAAGSHFDAGDPVCSLEASAAEPAALRRTLAARRQALRAWLATQTTSETTP